jgi:hypothetical protein
MTTSTGYTINANVSDGRKSRILIASVLQANFDEAYVDPSTPSVKYGGSSGTSFTSRQNQTMRYHPSSNPYASLRSTLLTYEVPEGDNGSKEIYTSVSAAPDNGRILVFMIYGAIYETNSNASGTSSSSSLTTTLNRGGYIVGHVSHVDTTPTISAYNGSTIVETLQWSSSSSGFIACPYIKEGAQSESVTGGGTWGSSKQYIHTRVAFDALGKEYMI